MFEAPRQIQSAVVGDGNFPGLAPLAQIDFSNILSLLWRGRATIFFTTVAALALAVLFVVLAPHEYTADTRIPIDPGGQVVTKTIPVLSKADLPQKCSSSPPSLVVALAALLLGAAAGTGIVLIRQPTAPGARADGIGYALRQVFAAMGFWPAPGVPVLAALPAVDVAFGLNAVDDPTSSFAKEMRKVYDEVRASHIAPGNPGVLVIAADDEDDGAIVALTLAAVAAATQRVLLIDADLERRTLAAIDSETADAGLVDVAIGRRLLADAIKLDRDTNINLIAFVAPGSRRERRIYDADIKRAFERTKCYDMVIVAAMDRGDPSIRFFGGLVDHIVLAAAAASYDEAAAEEFVARLGLDAAKVRGAVLTGAATA